MFFLFLNHIKLIPNRDYYYSDLFLGALIFY